MRKAESMYNLFFSENHKFLAYFNNSRVLQLQKPDEDYTVPYRVPKPRDRGESLNKYHEKVEIRVQNFPLENFNFMDQILFEKVFQEEEESEDSLYSSYSSS